MATRLGVDGALGDYGRVPHDPPATQQTPLGIALNPCLSLRAQLLPTHTHTHLALTASPT